MLKRLKELKEKPIDNIVMRLFSSWCLTASLLFAIAGDSFRDLNNFSKLGLFDFICVFVVVFGIISLVNFLIKKPCDRVILPFAFGIYSFAVLLFGEKDFFLCVCLCALSVIMMMYFYKTGGMRLKKPVGTKIRNFIIILSVLVVLTVGITIGVGRYRCFAAPNYDFGIFCQMFHNMRESFSPVTTCERDKLLSHFAVHVSPIYYLILPFYFVFPSPVTLQISQTAILVSAAVPAYLLCRHFRLPDFHTACVVSFTILQPAVLSGTFYDLHENCFLFPLLLWVFWAFEREKYVFLAVFSLLVLCVKEDAAIYIAFFAIFAILGRKKYLVGTLMLIAAGIWFFCTTKYLATVGDGVMTNRYDNYIGGGKTLLDAVKNILVDPAYVFTQMFLDSDNGNGAKTKFLLQLVVPLAFIPFVTKKVSRFLLLLPAVLINFMTLYQYQYDLTFQYAFGSAAFLTFLAILNLSDMEDTKKTLFATAALICSSILFVGLNVNHMQHYVRNYKNQRPYYAVMEESLASVPSDASVCASAFLLPHLSDRSVLYETYYHTFREGEILDYIILDARLGTYDGEREKFESLGYKITQTVKKYDKMLIVYMQYAGEPTDKTVTGTPSGSTEKTTVTGTQSGSTDKNSENMTDGTVG